MLYFYQAILYLFLINNFVYTGNQENQYPLEEKKPVLASEKHINTDPLSPPALPDDLRKKLFEQKEEFDKDEIEEMEMVLEAAPLKAQFIPKHLQDPTFFSGCEKFRSAYFIGKPGTGKTIAATAIAHQMSQKGWDYIFISSTELVEGYRNQTCIHIRQKLESIVSSGRPTIIIIDEISRLLENADSKNHDTDMSATAIWSFLDKQLKNEKLFLIGTMNSAENLPQPFKNRINSNAILFQSKASTELKIKHLRKKLTNNNSSLHKEVTDEFLKNELEKVDSCYGRGLIHLTTHILMLHKINTKESHSIITKTSIINGINEYLLNEEMLKTNKKTETDEERQERYHQENIALQEQHHRENIIANVAGNVAANIVVKALEKGAIAAAKHIFKNS